MTIAVCGTLNHNQPTNYSKCVIDLDIGVWQISSMYMYIVYVLNANSNFTLCLPDRRTFKQTPRFRSRSQYESYETRLPEEPDVSEYCVDIICVIDYSIFKK